MTEEEYEEAVDALLRSLGSSYSTPSGWQKGGLAFSCANSVIVFVPFASETFPEERKFIVEDLRRKYAP